MLEIKKRNGTVAPFDAGKIAAAMEKAFVASSWPYSAELLAELTREVVRRLDERFLEQVPSVENVQDFVELELMQHGFLEVANHYIVYRYEHAKIREEKKQEFLE
ncbi:MAG: ATP cone domain-containing protein, partial [Minisyncoccia bacterium]